MIYKFFNFFKKNFYREKLKKHNKKIFNNYKNKNIILVELNKWAYLHIIKSYLANVLSNKFNAEIVGFESYTLISDSLKKNLFHTIIRNLMIFLSLGTYGVYKSFGVQRFLYPKIDNSHEINHEKIINYYLKKINSKKKLINMKIKNIYIGDLLYDTFLKISKLPTIDIKSNSFKIFLKESIILFLWWHNFFKKNKSHIKALIIIHSVYLFGLQARIGNYFNIRAYKPSHKSIMIIDKKNTNHCDDVFLNFRHLGKIKNKKNIYNYSNQEINKIISGISSVGNNYSNKIRKIYRIKKLNNNIKILVVCHSFFDAPHSFGKFFANDFYEWLILLGELSKVTNYTWLIKPHPVSYDEDKLFLKKILDSYPKFELIDKNYTNQEILNTGIDFALTCFGTVSFEYPFLGIKVINFTNNHPFKRFNFSYTPKNLDHYIKILKNLKKFNYKFKKNKILEYYYIKRFILDVDYMELNLDKNKDMKGYRLKEFFFKEDFYKKWIDLWNLKKHESILKNIENYIQSNELFMSKYNIKKKN